MRIKIGSSIYIITTCPEIGEGTPVEDLWNAGYRIGFTRISRFIRPLGIYLFLATYEPVTNSKTQA